MCTTQGRLSAYVRNHWLLYAMSLPGLVFLFVYKLLPLCGLTLAFKRFNPFLGDNLLQSMLKSPWVGFDNFKTIFNSDQFWLLLKNTVEISVLKILVLFPLPILLALLMNEMRSRWFKRTVQTLIYLPHFLSWVIIYGIFSTLLSSDGVVNTILQKLGIHSVQFFTSPGIFRSLLVATDGWKEAGWGTIVYLAALTAIDPAQYEAAIMDGANRAQRLWHISLPGITPVVVLMLLLRVGNILQAGFEQILVMYNPTVYSVADILQTYIYRVGLGKLDFSTGTVMGLFESATGLILILSCNGISRKLFGRSLW